MSAPLRIGEEWCPCDDGWGDACLVHADLARPAAAAVRSGIERGDPFAVLAHRPVGVGVDAGQRIRATNWPTLPAVTNQPVADHSHGSDLPLGNLTGDTDGQNADAMEHERQRRLRSWQRLP